jgi:hypothetical protein
MASYVIEISPGVYYGPYVSFEGNCRTQEMATLWKRRETAEEKLKVLQSHGSHAGGSNAKVIRVCDGFRSQKNLENERRWAMERIAEIDKMLSME